MLEVRLLGQFEVNKEGERIDIPSRPAQSLLAYLILRAGTAHRREKLAGLLWPDSDEKNARGNLRHAIWRLRQAIGAEYIPSDKISLSFDADREYWLDSAVVERAGQPSTDGLMRDLAVYGGELLPGFYDDWTVLDRERLRAVFEGKIQTLLDKLLAEQRWQEASEWGERWIALGYVPEPAYRAMMIAAAGMGDTAGVAAIFRRCEDALRAELGVDPSERTRRVYQELSSGGAPQALIDAEPPPSAAVGVERMLAGWRDQGVEVLDVASLAIVYAASPEQRFDELDSSLLIRSALAHDVDVEPWLTRAPSEAAAIEALIQSFDEYPRPQIRKRIVRALDGMEGKDAARALGDIAIKEDNPSIRAEAAVAAARRGSQQVTEYLRLELIADGDGSALAAFVAVADEVGLPQEIGPYPGFPVAFELGRRRWRRWKPAILRQSLRAALGGGSAMAFVAVLPVLIVAVLDPVLLRETLEVVTLPIWIVINTVMGLVWGGAQGGAIGLAVGIADTISMPARRGRLRVLFAGLAGLIHSTFVIFTAATGGTWTSVEPIIFIPIYTAYGLIVGMGLSIVFPRLGQVREWRPQLIEMAKSSLVAATSGVIAVYLAHGASLKSSEATGSLTAFLLYAILFPLGITLAIQRGPDMD
ncbi:MAG: hypothetical protein BMS9Abin28_0446 [Anaerolineae bacterium]|nr:MAG: hypothetical protein BMS9Abin28_0446 [Anaerolineae bacterium]